MSILLSTQQLSCSFGARPLFSGVSFTIESGDRIGLIGPNGAGKSTLLRILASQISPDQGSISFQRGLKIAFLEQAPRFSEGATILSTLLEGVNDPDEWEDQALAHEFFSKLELDRFTPDLPVEILSGGWKKRVALGRELVKKPDLLLLDEPTNHLDVESILWLEAFLSKNSYTTLTITHDRLFLQRVSTRIFELDRRNQGGLLDIKGSYSQYLEVKDQIIQAQERRETVLKNTLRRETEWLRRGAKARTTKQEARIQRAGDLEDEVEELSRRNQVRTARIDFQSSEKNPKKLIEAKNISKSYGERSIFSNLSLLLTPGTRLGLLGPNGCGKSSLIRVLLGLENPDRGSVIQSEHLSVSYFDQTRNALDPDLSLVRTLCPTGDHVDYRGTRVHIRSYLDRFLFEPGQMDMAVGKLSGGEQSRLLIARLMLTQANVLVLDEPTNDLDMATLNVLEECLSEFSGAVVLVSHDRYFLDQVTNQILAFVDSESPFEGSSKNSSNVSLNPTSGKRLVFFSDYHQWENWQEAHQNKGTSEPEPRLLEKRAEPEKKKRLGFNEQRELDAMESKIHSAEEALSRLVHESSQPDIISNAIKLTQLTSEMSRLQIEIDRLYQRWSELEDKK